MKLRSIATAVALSVAGGYASTAAAGNTVAGLTQVNGTIFWTEREHWVEVQDVQNNNQRVEGCVGFHHFCTVKSGGVFDVIDHTLGDRERIVVLPGEPDRPVDDGPIIPAQPVPVPVTIVADPEPASIIIDRVTAQTSIGWIAEARCPLAFQAIGGNCHARSGATSVPILISHTRESSQFCETEYQAELVTSQVICMATN